jgi:hypothetical protein
MAAVPLLYLRSDPPVTFGCLVILGRQARTTFTEREQAMVIRLSGMIVYQLATFVSPFRGTVLIISNRNYQQKRQQSCMKSL